LGTRSRFLGAFRGLRLSLTGSALSWSASQRVCVTTLARVSLPLQTGQLLTPSQGLCHSASTAGSRLTSGAVLPGTLASPRARLALAGCPELVARVVAVDHPLSGSSFTCAPSWLDAPGCREIAPKGLPLHLRHVVGRSTPPPVGFGLIAGRWGPAPPMSVPKKWLLAVWSGWIRTNRDDVGIALIGLFTDGGRTAGSGPPSTAKRGFR